MPTTKNTDKDRTKAQFVFFIDPIFASGDLRKLKSSPFRKHHNRELVKSVMGEAALRVREDQIKRIENPYIGDKKEERVTHVKFVTELARQSRPIQRQKILMYVLTYISCPLHNPSTRAYDQ
jgi:hypothetical protein